MSLSCLFKREEGWQENENKAIKRPLNAVHTETHALRVAANCGKQQLDSLPLTFAANCFPETVVAYAHLQIRKRTLNLIYPSFSGKHVFHIYSQQTKAHISTLQSDNKSY